MLCAISQRRYSPRFRHWSRCVTLLVYLRDDPYRCQDSHDADYLQGSIGADLTKVGMSDSDEPIKALSAPVSLSSSAAVLPFFLPSAIKLKRLRSIAIRMTAFWWGWQRLMLALSSRMILLRLEPLLRSNYLKQESHDCVSRIFEPLS